VDTVHKLPAELSKAGKINLVDPKKHKLKDPGAAIHNGTSVDQAVTAGFASGLFTFSEIVFDSDHKLAAFRYSFVCGILCGNGGTVIYELKDGKWSPTKRRCSSWIS
jgi:hypothetical protein